MERRLRRRYCLLVKSHCRAATELAAGVSSILGANAAWSATQGAWRFLNNERIGLDTLVQPLREVGAWSSNPSSNLSLRPVVRF